MTELSLRSSAPPRSGRAGGARTSMRAPPPRSIQSPATATRSGRPRSANASRPAAEAGDAGGAGGGRGGQLAAEGRGEPGAARPAVDEDAPARRRFDEDGVALADVEDADAQAAVGRRGGGPPAR